MISYWDFAIHFHTHKCSTLQYCPIVLAYYGRSLSMAVFYRFLLFRSLPSFFTVYYSLCVHYPNVHLINLTENGVCMCVLVLVLVQAIFKWQMMNYWLGAGIHLKWGADSFWLSTVKRCHFCSLNESRDTLQSSSSAEQRKKECSGFAAPITPARSWPIIRSQ